MSVAEGRHPTPGAIEARRGAGSGAVSEGFENPPAPRAGAQLRGWGCRTYAAALASHSLSEVGQDFGTSEEADLGYPERKLNKIKLIFQMLVKRGFW